MATEKKTEAQQVYERIEELASDGTAKFADAVRMVAAERDKKENAVRANYYNHKKKLDGTGGATSSKRRGRPRQQPAPLTVESALSQAASLLQQALDGIDREVEAAKAEAEAAQARYEELVASVADRKSKLEQKLQALL